MSAFPHLQYRGQTAVLKLGMGKTSEKAPIEPWFGESSAVIPPLQKPRPERELRLGLVPNGPSMWLQCWLSVIFNCLHV